MTGTAARGVRIEDLEHSYTSEPVLQKVCLEVESGESIALLGPSGCGKTTLLRLLAGLEVPDSGSIQIGGEVVAGTKWVPPDRRRVGMVFQDWALFPHLSVEKNVGYGVAKSADKEAEVKTALEMVGLLGLEERMPATLSGGQQQRVALARALAPKPSVLLLDEPFSNLDTSLRVEVRTEVHRLLADLGITSIFVTHDQDEAFIVGDRVAVMRSGEIVQTDSPQKLYHHPIDRWIAEFVGMVSVLRGQAKDGSVACELGTLSTNSAIQGEVDVIFRPEQLEIERGGNAEVQLVEYYGHDTMVFVSVGEHQLQIRCGASSDFKRGDKVTVSFTDTKVLTFSKT
ncbi:MAG: ABC transporter [Acidimicrobiaceae bacterium]|jgi:iron(III) transport system ATP-binding protein|nr:ABC transporter [Acidimicrobiaceae bacterium]MCH2634126.1 ABC transporter ATP-binding protein [Acidimicrobiales bacterium]|tara:strand:- start:1169 stop:2194 length:1026 start_codon:yes stop_codon:yes gene_type:complete